MKKIKHFGIIYCVIFELDLIAYSDRNRTFNKELKNVCSKCG